jgi:cyclophilin family peptidyl-prolyl cis-trans isomerase
MSVNKITQKLRNLFSRFAGPRKPLAARPQRARLDLLTLEDRTALSTYTGTINGLTYLDANHNQKFDGEVVLPGMNVQLYGHAANGTTVNTVVNTNSSGTFSFRNVLPGTYELIGRAPGVYASLGTVTTPFRPLGEGKTLTFHLGFQGGFNSTAIGLNQFLTTSNSTSFPALPGGPGVKNVLSRSDTAPTVSSTIAAVSGAVNSADTTVNLEEKFKDVDFSNSLVQFQTNYGNINVQLFDKVTPIAVANFFSYVNSGAYNNLVITRHETTGINVIQTGGYTFNAGAAGTAADPKLVHVTSHGNIKDEFTASGTNALFTLAMANTGAANTSGSEFFINLKDNSSALSSTAQGGQGFTVFGRVITPSSVNAGPALKAIAGVPHFDESGNNTLPFNSVPLKDYHGTSATFPNDLTAANVIIIKQVKILKRDEFLTYTATSNHTDIATASVVNDRLVIHKVGPGTATITVKATDRYGASVTTTVNVTVTNNAPTATVQLNTSQPKVTDTLTATTTSADANNDPVTLTFAWKKQDGTVLPSTTNTLNLGSLNNVHKGDQITVTVTPNDGHVNGTAATATATIANSAPVATAVNITSADSPMTTSSTLQANATATDIDGDAITWMYSWAVVGGATLQSSASSTLDLSLLTPGTVNSGDQITVSATPSDSTLLGNTLTSAAITLS